MTEYPKTDRARMVQWAFQVELKGNTQSVHAARRCLLYLVSVCSVGKHHYLRAWHNTREIAEYTGLKERTAQRALKRLIDAGLIRRVFGGQHSCFSVQYPTK